MKKKRFVWVKWFDAAYQNDVCTEDQLDPDLIMETAGFLVCEDESSISIAQDWCADDKTWRHTTHVPKVLIIKLKRYDLPGT